MKTLLIVSHPNILESGSQQFFLTAVKENENVTIHHLEDIYPDGKIDVAKEQQLLCEHDRIIFQFPFYWYSSPPLLKHWQDVVLEEGFAYGKRGRKLVGKEFGLVIMIGVHEREYQAGGSELFTINELTKPFQAIAHKTGMKYLRPFTVFQFFYWTEDKKLDMVMKYQQMLTMENNLSLETRENWIIEQLERASKTTKDEDAATVFQFTISTIKENRLTLDELKIVLDQMYGNN
ncbi:NAD(P)H-dependent oxidoreductase [Bacillus kwashiorkori]|uniref:NAD(P)H-dependent oxidoreductase n=1 Tax=Bacillus kwashiorkori TaxID=1522318 RepID=UPI00078355B2|nr:NAD(P)H-dependent oxidoreductase [Bacillus kwashiorkori]